MAETATIGPDSPAETPGDIAGTETPETPDASSPGSSQSEGKGNREARYRVERNEAREALAAAEERITAYQRADVLRAASALAEPEDVFSLTGQTVADFLTDSGDVNTDAVSAAVASVLEKRPGLRKPAPAVDRSPGGSAPEPKKPEATWSDFFAKNH